MIEEKDNPKRPPDPDTDYHTRGIDWATEGYGVRNKHPRSFLDKHPEGRYSTEEETMYAVIALCACNGDVKKAMTMMRQWYDDGETTVYIPENDKKADYYLRAIKGKHKDIILQHLVTDEIIWKMRDLYMKTGEGSNTRVALEAMKYLWDRADGKPVSKVEQNVNFTTFEEINQAYQANIEKFQNGVWVNPEIEDGSGE